MKILVIGAGRCGGRIADEFVRLNSRARGKRGLEIISGAFTVNTDAADLVELTSIKADYRHRILIGGERTGGKGVGGLTELGAEIARENADLIAETIREVKHFYETDAIFIIAGAAGGTGSGAVPALTQRFKQRYPDKSVYAVIVLPSKAEEEELEQAVFNTAVCLKSTSSIADAVFLFDNGLYAERYPALKEDYPAINRLIIEPFYNLLCAGEEKRKKHIGSKLLDAGDIIQTLEGWTVMGSSRIKIPAVSFLGGSKKGGTPRGIKAIDEAVGEISLQCSPADAGKAIYLISAPAGEMNVDLIKDLGDYLKNMAPSATIRSGDYPVERGLLEVTVIVSNLNDVPSVRDFYTRSVAAAEKAKKRSPRGKKESPEV